MPVSSPRFHSPVSLSFSLFAGVALHATRPVSLGRLIHRVSNLWVAAARYRRVPPSLS